MTKAKTKKKIIDIKIFGDEDGYGQDTEICGATAEQVFEAVNCMLYYFIKENDLSLRSYIKQLKKDMKYLKKDDKESEEN